jgi:hypothetical protein
VRCRPVHEDGMADDRCGRGGDQNDLRSETPILVGPSYTTLFVVLSDYPSLEVGLNDVAPTDDRHYSFVPVAGSVLQYRRNAKGGRRLHDKSRVTIEHSHSDNDAVFLN